MTNEDRRFDFTNVRKTVIPAGISLENNGMILLPGIALLVIFAGTMIMRAYRRRRCTGQ